MKSEDISRLVSRLQATFIKRWAPSDPGQVELFGGDLLLIVGTVMDLCRETANESLTKFLQESAGE